PSPSTPTFESRLRESQPEAAISTSIKGSSAATIAITKVLDKANKDIFNARFADNFNSIN
ncbi:hypothetical protein GQ44DRAFT_631416, partial [Phaeosphaeriaceae sp. PMI808]